MGADGVDGAEQPPLYGWQKEALDAWRSAGHRGIVEAVTGTGKTRVGIEAIREALDEDRSALILVPTAELQHQWFRRLRREFPGSVRIGRAGDGHHDTLARHDVVVAIVNSRRGTASSVPAGALLVADECHRYAPDENRKALRAEFDWRVGLTAVLERPDGRETRLVDFFGPVCARVGYPQALADGVVAPFSVALIGIDLTPAERSEYRRLSKVIGQTIHQLEERHGFTTDPFSMFMQRVNREAREGGPAAVSCRRLVSSIAQRRDLLASSRARQRLVDELAPAVVAADRAIVFTETIGGAGLLARTLESRHVSTGTIHSELKRDERRVALDRFRRGDLEVIVAPRVLDEGVDVPAADLAVVVSGSRTRRQMVQRMGRVLRRKDDGRLARIAICFAKGTTEDPADGAHETFLSEVTSVAEDYAVFRSGDLEEALVFLCTDTPFQPAPQPRFAGEAPRPFAGSKLEEDELSAREFLVVREDKS